MEVLMECDGLPPLLEVKRASRPLYSKQASDKKEQASMRTPKQFPVSKDVK